MYEKLDKKIASSRVYSRRQADYLIKNNKVKVNNNIVNLPNMLVKPQDIIKVNNKVIQNSNSFPRLWLFYKPKGYLTTKSDPYKRPTIYSLLPKSLQLSLYVGRLDFNSEGLLLLTNSGDLVNYLTSTKNNITRIYKVKTFGKFTQEYINILKKGITIDKVTYRSIHTKVINQTNLQTWITFTLLEGKNNEIRKICNYFNLKVSKLIRTNFGSFTLGKLPKGAVKEISITKLKKHFPFLFS